MRGKHGNAAKNRRERTELDQRAETAERRAERAEKELAELRESSQRIIGSLRAELAKARKDRDAAVSPLLQEERARSLQLRSDLRLAQGAADAHKESALRIAKKVAAHLDESGLPAEQVSKTVTQIRRTLMGDFAELTHRAGQAT